MQKVGFSGQGRCEGARPGSWGLGFWGSGPSSSLTSVGGCPPSGEGSGQVGFFQRSPGSPKNSGGCNTPPFPTPCTPPRQFCLVAIHDPAVWKEESSLKWTAWPFDLKRLHGALRTMACRGFLGSSSPWGFLGFLGSSSPAHLSMRATSHSWGLMSPGIRAAVGLGTTS